MVSTLEANVELQTSALKFLEIFSTELYKLPTISPDIIQSLEIVSGDWGIAGFSFLMHYTLDGIPQVIKAVVENIDLIDLSITFKAMEGDVLDVYNSFKIIYKLTPHILSGSVVHVIIEYGKPSDDTPDPTSLMEEVIQVSKNVDAYAGNLI